MKHTVLLLVVVGLLAACGANLQSASSGKVGCAPREITISDDDGGWGTRTWTASCHGKRFFCSATGENAISCKEETR